MATTRAPRSRFYLHMAIAFLAIGIVGFSTTFLLPLARGTFRAPPLVHVHGALLFGWLGLFIAQAWLVQARRTPLHRRLGVLGAGLAAGIVVSGVLVGLWATRRDLAAGEDPFVLGQFVNILIEMLLFAALVGAAVALRRDRESHKRLLMLATISLLGPAWIRFRHLFPAVDNPFVVFSLMADAVLLVAVAHDLRVHGRVHPVYLGAGGAMVAVHMVELAAMQSPAWQTFARWLLGLPA